jgi:hypothetical protein
MCVLWVAELCVCGGGVASWHRRSRH